MCSPISREYFPDKLQTAVRQKARWIVGICIQAWRDHGWTGNAATRYSLYRDRKALFTNLLTLYGYAVVALALLIDGLHVAFPRSIAAVPIARTNATLWLFGAVMAMTVLRVVQKVYFVTQMYGWLIGLLSIVRLPWSGVINAFATGRALYLVVSSARHKKAVVWHKTAHVFPSEASLGTFAKHVAATDEVASDIVVEEASELVAR